jgi:hypothetical protein
MINLPESLKAWNTPEFKAVLKREMTALGGRLPLQEGLSHSSYALDDTIEAVVQRVSETAEEIHARVGIFYSGIVAGCSCADDPTPVEAQTEYCELEVVIDKATARAAVALARD